ncbi:MAG TPA: sterol desaturase family protein [Candidatus Angelobacter sp.]|nr:sterol desaturase family protein [Candidatus Angelobacter sp.]
MHGWIEGIVDCLAAPVLYVDDPLRRLYWLYLLAALVLAAAVFFYRHRASRSSLLKDLVAYVAPRRIYGNRSARLDYWFFYLNAVVFGLILAPLVGAPAVAVFVADMLGGSALASAPAGPWWSLGLTIVTLLAMDLALYIGHYLQHRVAFLWEFHKVHHSAEVLTPITAFRVHPVDDLLTLSLTALFTGVVQGLFHVAAGTGIADIQVLGVNVLLFAWYIFGFHLRHSHVWLAYPAWLSHILVSPAQHQIHHSNAPRHFDRNMGFIFAFWDAMGGTLYVPKAREELSYGLYGEEPGQFASVPALYLRPLLNLWAMRSRSAGLDRISPPAADASRPLA